MYKKVLSVLLMFLLLFYCACSESSKETENLRPEEGRYKELTMQSLVNATFITRITLFYEGKNYYITDDKRISELKSKWEEATLKDVEVSLVKEELPPGFLYTITIETKDKTEQDYVFTIIKQADASIQMVYDSPEKKEYQFVGIGNSALADFLDGCMQSME